MTVDDFDGRGGRGGAKRDRLARMARLVRILESHPDGIRVDEMATRVGMSRRTVYRDLVAVQDELHLPVWGEDGVWGIDADKAFLPPLKLTQAEAMAVVLSARLMARFADKYDPDLAAAFEKLGAVLPVPLREHVERTLVALARAPRDDHYRAIVKDLTLAWADRRVVEIDYEPAHYDAGSRRRRATVRPYLLEPSLQTHALYLIGHDEEKDAIRTFKVERIRSASVTPRSFEPPDGTATTMALRAAWDIIADQPLVDVELRFSPAVAARVSETIWHPSQTAVTDEDGALRWRATVSGVVEIRLWILSWGADVEVVSPPDLREDVAERLRAALARYEAAAP